MTNMQKKMKHKELLAEVATMYFKQDLTQSEIADILCLSRTRISRLLKKAKDEGIVTFQINHIGKRAFELENYLKRKYKLKEAYVLNNHSLEYNESLIEMAQLAKEYIESQLIDKQTVGISWGRSIAQTIDALAENHTLSVDVVQIMGGMMIRNPEIEVSEITRKMVTKYNGRGFYLNAPLYIKDEATRITLKKMPIISKTLIKGKNSDMIITGIGDLSKDTSSYLWSGYDNEDELLMLQKSGGKGIICAQAYDINGDEVETGFNEKVISVSLREIKKIKTVIGISGGKRKAEAVLGALRGGYINVLITDYNCIKEIISLEKER